MTLPSCEVLSRLCKSTTISKQMVHMHSHVAAGLVLLVDLPADAAISCIVPTGSSCLAWGRLRIIPDHVLQDVRLHGDAVTLGVLQGCSLHSSTFQRSRL